MWVTSSCERGMGLQLMIYSSLGTQQRDLGFRERREAQSALFVHLQTQKPASKSKSHQTITSE